MARMTQQTLQNETLGVFCGALRAAEILGAHKATVTRLVHRGMLTPVDMNGGGPLVFRIADVERLRAIRDGEIGDVLDRVDLHAAEGDPVEDRDAYVRDAWLNAVRIVTDRTGGTFATGQLRAHLPDDAKGHTPGGFITGLVRSKRIEWTGDYDTLNDSRARHSSSPCKVYRVVGDLA